MKYSRKKFFDAVRTSFGPLKNPEIVAGFEAILKAWEDHYPNGDIRHLAYLMATTWHETGGTMQPIREAFGTSTADSIARLDRAWAKGQLKNVKTVYWRTGYFGRGYVQLTHEENYRKASVRLKELFGIDEDFVKNPDRVMIPEYAFLILAVGSTEGWFAGDKKGRHTLDRYFNATVDDPEGARRIINGTDALLKIARHHSLFLGALRDSQEAVDSPEPAIVVVDGPKPSQGRPSLAVSILVALKGWLTGKL